MIASMADALASAGMLLAAMALVFSAWTPSIEASIKDSFSPGDEARQREKDAVRSIRNRRACPMAIGSWLIAIAFLPRDFRILGSSVTCMRSAGPCFYDDVAAIFLLTQLLIGFLAWHVSGQVRALTRKAG